MYWPNSRGVPTSARRAPAIKRPPLQLAFGQRVRDLRTLRGWTQDDLADRCGLFRTYMSRIETGAANPTLSMIHALATSLGVPVAALFETGEVALAPVAARRGGSRGKVR